MLSALVYTGRLALALNHTVESCCLGFQLGPILTFVTCGYLCKYVGWESIFYIYGGLGILWAAVWTASVGDGPETQCLISKAERKYIVDSLADTSKKVCTRSRALVNDQFRQRFAMSHG